MKKAVFVPDSFKGTISSADICDIMKKTVLRYFPDCATVSVPVSDGGEGLVECLLTAAGGKRTGLSVSGPLFKKVDAFYGVLPDNTAVIEMSAAAGLPLAEALGEKDTLKATTYGVGELILDAAKRGHKKLLLGLGGSATTDGGTGAAAALGVKFFDKNGKSFIPVGGTLKNIAKIDASGLYKEVADAEIVTICDIDNPLFGENGAAFIFAPQKGASPDDVRLLDDGLRHLSEKIKECLGKDVSELSGAGAAGGLGGGAAAFFGGTLRRGIDAVLDTVNFDEIIKDADVIFTGEGAIDGQSLRGKVVIGVARRAKALGVPVIVIAGDVKKGAEAAYENGAGAIFSTNLLAKDFSQVKPFSREFFSFVFDSIVRSLKLAEDFRR